MAKSDFFGGRNWFIFPEVAFTQRRSFSQVPKKCTDLDLSLLYNLILGTSSKFARQNNLLSFRGSHSERLDDYFCVAR